MYEIFLNSAAGLLSHINELLSHKLVAGNCYYCMNIKNCNMLRKRNALVEMHGAEFKQAGYWLIDQIADFIDNISRRPVTVNMSSAQLSEIIGHHPLPEYGKAATEIVHRIAEILFNYSLLNGHPKFLGYI